MKIFPICLAVLTLQAHAVTPEDLYTKVTPQQLIRVTEDTCHVKAYESVMIGLSLKDKGYVKEVFPAGTFYIKGEVGIMADPETCSADAFLPNTLEDFIKVFKASGYTNIKKLNSAVDITLKGDAVLVEYFQAQKGDYAITVGVPQTYKDEFYTVFDGLAPIRANTEI